MHCDLLKKVTGHEAMCQGLRETACKYEINILQITNIEHTWVYGQR